MYVIEVKAINGKLIEEYKGDIRGLKIQSNPNRLEFCDHNDCKHVIYYNTTDTVNITRLKDENEG